MKKLITLLLVLLLFGCQHRDINKITKNSKESHSGTKVYNLNDCKNVTIEIYELVDYEWNLIHAHTLDENCAKLSIECHIPNIGAQDNKTSYLQYHTFDQYNNELYDSYSKTFTVERYLSYRSSNVSDIKYESSQKHVIAIYEWEYETAKLINDIKLDEKHKAEHAYLIVLS